MIRLCNIYGEGVVEGNNCQIEKRTRTYTYTLSCSFQGNPPFVLRAFLVKVVRACRLHTGCVSMAMRWYQAGISRPS